MQPQVITVHDIHKSIEDVGVLPYANTLVQDMGGEYWFVDAERLSNYEPGMESVSAEWSFYEHKIDVKTEERYPDGTYKSHELVEYWRYRLCPVPQKLAYFIISALRLKSIASHLELGERHVEKQTVYLPPGAVIFGHKIEKLTEIPAELGPVVVERL